MKWKINQHIYVLRRSNLQELLTYKFNSISSNFGFDQVSAIIFFACSTLISYVWIKRLQPSRFFAWGGLTLCIFEEKILSTQRVSEFRGRLQFNGRNQSNGWALHLSYYQLIIAHFYWALLQPKALKALAVLQMRARCRKSVLSEIRFRKIIIEVFLLKNTAARKIYFLHLCQKCLGAGGMMKLGGLGIDTWG